jgi:hypothetical protein
MSGDRSRKRRWFAAECLALAKQSSDLKVRASLLAMAQKWLDLANDEFVSHELNAWNKTFYHRAIQTKIGQGLRAQYDLSPDLPQPILTLLTQLDA